VQVIAHRVNTLEGIQACWAAGCDWVEVDVCVGGDGALWVSRDLALGGVRLAEVLAGEGGLYLDVKSGDASAVAGAVRGRERTWIWSARTEFLRELLLVDDSLAVLPQAHSAERLAAALEELRPGAVAFAAWDYREELIAMAQAAGALTFVDLLGEWDTEEQWRRAVALGVSGVMTDRPVELLAWLRR